MTRKRAKGPIIEEDLLRKARAMAVSQENRRHAAWERIQPLLNHPPSTSAAPAPPETTSTSADLVALPNPYRR